MNVRFWFWWNDSAVKLTLRPGQTINFGTGGPDEEGWHYDAETIDYHGDFLTRKTYSGGTDCDGRLERESRLRCHVLGLRFYPYGNDNAQKIAFPKWEMLFASQRDQFAEAAGY